MAAPHHRRMHERQHETVLLKQQQPRREVSAGAALLLFVLIQGQTAPAANILGRCGAGVFFEHHAEILLGVEPGFAGQFLDAHPAPGFVDPALGLIDAALVDQVVEAGPRSFFRMRLM